MSLALNVLGDMVRVADGLEPVTLRRLTSAIETLIPNALRRAVSKNESAASGGSIQLSDVRFNLPAEELPTPPAPNDQLIDASGKVWTILYIQVATCATRWNCLCRPA